MAEEKKQEQQVVEEIVEEEYVEDPHRWTFLKYIKSIAKFKWWVIGFSLAGALAGYLGFRFILNPMRKTLSAAYTYNLAGEYIDNDTIRFIDGTLFNPYELSSKENLQKVKDNNEKYASVNVDELAINNVIVINKNATILNEKDTSGNNIEINYIIKAKAKYFKNDDIGKEFLYDIINLAKDLSTSAINNYEARLVFTNNFDSLPFDKEISLLEDQYYSILSSYDSLISAFGSSASGDNNGTKLSEMETNYISQYYVSGISSFIEDLSGRKDAYKFVNYTIGQEEQKISEIHSLCMSYIQTIINNEKNIAVYEDRLDKLLASSSIFGTDTNVSKQVTELNSTIINLKINNSNLDKELNNNGYFLNSSGEYVFDELNTNTTIYKLKQKEANWVSQNAAFAALIKNYKQDLIANNDELTATYKYCYSGYKNKVNVQNGGYIDLTGSISSILGAAIGLVLFFVLTSIVTSIVYVYKEKDN